MSDIAKTIVDQIQDGQLQDAKDSINDGNQTKSCRGCGHETCRNASGLDVTTTGRLV